MARTNLGKEVLDVLALLPWWVCLVLAGLSFGLLHRMASTGPAVPTGGSIAPLVVSAMIRGIATGAQVVVPLMCVVVACLSAWRRKQRKDLLSNVADSNNAEVLDGMRWAEFEMLVGESFRMGGYQVAETGGGGPDGGIDLVLRKGQEKLFVQCKQWKAYKVGVSTVRELYGVMAARGASGGFVVTSGRFTADAKAFAQGRNIELIEGDALLAMIQQVRGAGTQRSSSALRHSAQPSSLAQAPSPFQNTGTVQATKDMPGETASRLSAHTPTCPKCGHEMVRRTAKHGSMAGQAFWGCGAFPKCRGIRPIA